MNHSRKYSMVLMVVLASSVAACHHKPSRDADASGSHITAADTLRGTIAVVGNEPQTTVTLTTVGRTTVVVRGPATSDLRAVTGIEVTLFGANGGLVNDGSLPREAMLFTADRFVVRTVNGATAHDGTLMRIESGFALRRADGSLTALPMVPLTLQANVGARIFWVGALDRTPSAYGIIHPAAK